MLYIRVITPIIEVCSAIVDHKARFYNQEYHVSGAPRSTPIYVDAPNV
jgi:hypothetical protein